MEKTNVDGKRIKHARREIALKSEGRAEYQRREPLKLKAEGQAITKR